MAEPVCPVLCYGLLFQILQESVPPFFTYTGSLPSFPSLLMSKAIFIHTRSKPYRPRLSFYKKSAVQWCIVLIEPLKKVIGIPRLPRRHGVKKSTK